LFAFALLALGIFGYVRRAKGVTAPYAPVPEMKSAAN
jgi:hypothetical protein